MTSVTTTDRHFHLLDGETLLDGLERTGHEVDYQCRSGYCGVCRLTLLSGEVSYDDPPLAYVGQSEILPCCCKVTQPIHVECRVSGQAELPLELEQQFLDL
ncbi:MAG TPA: class I ribonucleotide reductase maintenance protein YfaE [Burkholderiaceae bacterium]|nr:class I ribonucleotide reductase maintenance protein YfaE [Burkholderiaceae bacterium]